MTREGIPSWRDEMVRWLTWDGRRVRCYLCVRYRSIRWVWAGDQRRGIHLRRTTAEVHVEALMIMVRVMTGHILDMASKRHGSGGDWPPMVFSWRSKSGKTSNRVSRAVSRRTGWTRKLRGKHWRHWRLGELPIGLRRIFGGWLSCGYTAVVEKGRLPVLAVITIREFESTGIDRSCKDVSYKSLEVWRIVADLFGRETIDSHSLKSRIGRTPESVAEVGDIGYNGLQVQ